jgi:ubiquinone/menaquinone biosynthesis C-methylase UbiE
LSDSQVALAGGEAKLRAGAAPSLTGRLKERFYGDREHPYQTFERLIRETVAPRTVLLEAGCGRGAETLRRLAPEVRTAIGIDLVDFSNLARPIPGGVPVRDPAVHLCKNDVCGMALRDASVDVMVARSVMEHLTHPDAAYAEAARVLKPGGRFLFLTPQLWDYGSVCARLIPNRFHPFVVKKVEGRDERDTFPVHYRTNTVGAIRRLAERHGFRLESARHLNQYPCYLMFNPLLFLLGTAYERVTSRWEALRGLRGWLLIGLRKG